MLPGKVGVLCMVRRWRNPEAVHCEDYFLVWKTDGSVKMRAKLYASSHSFLWPWARYYSHIRHSRQCLVHTAYFCREKISVIAVSLKLRMTIIRKPIVRLFTAGDSKTKSHPKKKSNTGRNDHRASIESHRPNRFVSLRASHPRYA